MIDQYNLTKEFNEQVKPISDELMKKCRELGIPLLTFAMISVSEKGIEAMGLASPNREITNGIFMAKLKAMNAGTLDEVTGALPFFLNGSGEYHVINAPDGTFTVKAIEEDSASGEEAEAKAA